MAEFGVVGGGGGEKVASGIHTVSGYVTSISIPVGFRATHLIFMRKSDRPSEFNNHQWLGFVISPSDSYGLTLPASYEGRYMQVDLSVVAQVQITDSHITIILGSNRGYFPAGSFYWEATNAT